MYYYSFIIFFIFLGYLTKISGDTYNVKIDTEKHVNLIDSKFLSFTIDPKYLFSSSEKYRSKECICMASSLAPAYIRIAGPSTALLSFHNTTISLDEDLEEEHVRFQENFADDLSKEFKKRRLDKGLESRFKRNHDKIEVSHKDWRKFVHWAKSTGFELVFALNNEEKMSSGMWDPNTALNILTVAEKADIGDIYWQLGYECRNQSIEEYLNDLETLRVIAETFPPGRAGRWKVVGGDVTHCLHADSKSDFKDYVMLSDDMLDAILLNGKSATVELSRMSERDRLKLLRQLSGSSTPLWLADGPETDLAPLPAAIDWLTGLGQAARNGFSHHFRELGDDIYQPSLSFYMALLFKNLVGSRVLDVRTSPGRAVMFAHCAALRHAPVPGALTLYAANLEREPARFSVRLPRMEEGGDVLQFVLGEDTSGNIQVNGRPMYFEGDLKPVVKRVRPYKTLVINLPAKSFGFWVLANTKVKACYEDEKLQSSETVETLSEESDGDGIDNVKIKRSILTKDFEEYTAPSNESFDFFDEESTDQVTDKNIIIKMANLNNDLNKVQELFRNKSKDHKRSKRQTIQERINERRRKLRRYGIPLRNNKITDSEQTPKGIGNLIQRVKRNLTTRFKNSNRPFSRLSRNKISKRNPKTKAHQELKSKMKKRERETEKSIEIRDTESKSRARRSVSDDKVKSKNVQPSVENEIDDLPTDKVKLWKILKRIHRQLKDLSEENEYEDEEDNMKTISSSGDEDKEILGNETGLIKKTVGNLMGVLSDLNKNLHRFWNAIHLLD